VKLDFFYRIWVFPSSNWVPIFCSFSSYYHNFLWPYQPIFLAG
jgi:hypothetical protein